MTAPQAKVNSTKLAAALRLIQAAIQMEEQGVDRMATLVVAASALNMLREILKKRGTTFEMRTVQSMLWVWAQNTSARQGIFYEAVSEIVEPFLDRINEFIKSGFYTSYADIEIENPGGMSAFFLNPVYGPYNFLKHADRDTEHLLAETDIQASDAIMLSIAAYNSVFPSEVPPEPLASYMSHWKP